MIGKGPECPSVIPAAQIEADRLVGGRSIAPPDEISDAASVGSDPASTSPRLLPPPEPELSLRKKPITDFGCLGLLIPPDV